MANINVNVTDGNNINLQVTPTPRQTIQINRGVQGASGNNDIGGYPVSITSAQNYDALMFVSNEWINVNQLEIADGGNF
jgi:hypothetical protein